MKYRDDILIYLVVTIVSSLIGILVRIDFIEKGADEFTANFFFLICIGLGILLFAFIQIFLNELYQIIKRKFFKKKAMEMQISNDNLEKITEEQNVLDANIQALEVDTQITEIDNNIIKDNNQSNDGKKTILDDNNQTLEFNSEAIDEVQKSYDLNNLSDIKKIRNKARLRQEEIFREKLDFIKQYTEEKLAPYITDEDLYKLWDYLLVFLQDSKIENIDPIKVNTTLKPIDLEHLLWNIWNLYKGNNERKDVALFLKTVIPHTFKDAELETIEKRLSSNPEDGTIKINKKLL